MHHVILPDGKEGDILFVLTVDTMGLDHNGVIHGKPKDRKDAVQKIKALSGKEATSATAFCLHKKIWKNGVGK